MIADLIIQYQTGCNSAAETLINKFNPPLRKYSYLLNYEDAYDDIVVEFINLLRYIKLKHLQNNNDGTLTIYIQKSIHSCSLGHKAT